MVWIAIMVGVGLIVTLIAIALMFKMRKQKIEPDYRAIFILGVIFAGSGSAMISTSGISSMGMFGLGLIYMAIGIANRDKWKEQPKPLSSKTRNIMMLVLLGTVILVGLTFLAIYLIG
jgi:phosphotransferase system  glucose/maltose/N-acetylglucosamine-specific IIC component